MSPSSRLSYRDAGVDIDVGNAFVRRILPHVLTTRRPEVLGSLGGFSGFFDLSGGGWKEPVLVASTDGVGTKLRIAFLTGRHDTVGIDLVAMVANDLLVTGAQPLLFLDYYASGRLDPDVGEAILKGIAEGCRQAGMALLGGETAEMPGMYAGGEYDLAGFGVGMVEKSRIIDGSGLKAGLVLVGLASSGLHSNGFSLARKVLFERGGYKISDTLPELGAPLGEALLTPTRIYARAAAIWQSRLAPLAMSHVTGGGFPDNIGRLLPRGVGAKLETAWDVPPIFRILQRIGSIETSEMRRTFNLGIGFIGFFPTDQADAAVRLAREAGESAWIIGRTLAVESGPVVQWEDDPIG